MFFSIPAAQPILFLNPIILTIFIGLKSALQALQIPSSSEKEGLIMGLKKWYVQNRHVTGLRKMWPILVKSKQ